MSKTQLLRGITPESVKRATLAARGENMLYALHSVQSETAVSISAVSLTNPCILTLASSVSLYPGQKVRIAGVNATVNGNRSVITAYGSTVVIDLDATAAAAYTSGGTLVCDITWDRMGVGQTQQIQGTKTGMWGNPTLGITGNATGLYAGGMTAGLGLLNLQDTSKGILILAVRCAFAANPTSVEEVMFCAGVSGQSAAGSAQGFIQLRCTTSGLLGLQYRRAAASDGGAANSWINYSTEAITANTEHTFTVAIDPVSGQYLLIKDDLVSDYLTNYLPVDGNSHAKPLAYAIGCNMDANNGISGTRLWGKGSSTPKMQYLHIVRNPRLVLSDALTFARDFHQSPADIPSVLLK